jgi:predicted enzyme related to lactoylglutathione lyase
LPTRASRRAIASRPRARKLRSTAALGLSLAFAGATLPAAAADLPPLNIPASTEHHTGKRIYAELVTPDITAAKQFYGKLFGWTFEDFMERDLIFTQASLNGQVIGGIYQKPLPPGRHPGWISFIATQDAAAATTLATQNGAKILLSPRNFANLGQEAILADPQGAVFALLHSNSGDPPDILVPAGDWIWSSLITTDPTTDAAFYKAIFGYQIYTLPEPQHLILASDNFARASINPIPAAWAGAKPRWLNYIRVDDATATDAQVEALGGRVIQQPHMDRHGGKISVVADPAGALFGLMEWPQESPAGNAK